MLRFKVLYPINNKPFPKQTIYDMVKEEKKIAGYLIVPPDSPHVQARKSGLSKKFKIVLIVALVALAVGAVLLTVFIYRYT
jgi:uncharacterized membrane protein affecting hemolysin expression